MGTWNQVTCLSRPTPLDVKCIHQVGMFCIPPLFFESDVTLLTLYVRCIHQVGMFCIHPLFSESDVTSLTFVC
jgi:hypothetical protein